MNRESESESESKSESETVPIFSGVDLIRAHYDIAGVNREGWEEMQRDPSGGHSNVLSHSQIVQIQIQI